MDVQRENNNVTETDSQEHPVAQEKPEESKNDLSEIVESPLAIEEKAKELKIELNAEFPSFIELRDALEKYQKENHVQLIVKDSKLLNAESTRRIIPKVYHLVNKSLMYHSITYCCKCHGKLKQKPGTRIKNIGAKRLNCPMYLRFKLTSDFQHLVLFDIYDVHNHDIDPNTFQLPPRQQVYSLSKLKRRQSQPGSGIDIALENMEPKEIEMKSTDIHALIEAAIKDVNSVSSLSQVDYEPLTKSLRLNGHDRTSKTAIRPGLCLNDKQTESKSGESDEEEDLDSEDDGSPQSLFHNEDPHSPLDPESSCSDSDEEEFRIQRHLLPFPIRLIGSAIQCSPELTAATKQLIDIQKANLLLEKRKLMLQTKQLELQNSKLALEVKIMEKNLATEMMTTQAQDTTIYLQA